MTNNDPFVTTLALAFARLLTQRLTAEERAEVLRRNRAGDPHACATNDFCDPNVVMLRAMWNLTGADSDTVLSNDASISAMGQAWDLAKEAEFWWNTTH